MDCKIGEKIINQASEIIERDINTSYLGQSAIDD